ncbi:MAG: hypothetical protein AAFV53_23735 [Myxococcota bacterium]
MIAIILSLLACSEVRETPSDASEWFTEGEDLDVREPVAFTDQPYDFPSADADGLGSLIDALFPTEDRTNVFAQGDDFGVSNGAVGQDCESEITPELPREFDAVVTLHPRFYFKTEGCDAVSDEKYYGSYFIQDRTGGVFVLGDSKVAHFDVGDRVRIKVRGVRTAYGQDMIYAHDIVDVARGERQPVFFETVEGRRLGDEDMGRVKRIEGVVISEKDTFGEFTVQTDDGIEHSVSLDVELNRRGLEYAVGTRVQVTAPVLFSFDLYSLVVMEIGQITVVD